MEAKGEWKGTRDVRNDGGTKERKTERKELKKKAGKNKRHGDNANERKERDTERHLRTKRKY